MSSNSINHAKQPGMVAYAYNLCAGETEKEEPLGLTGPASLGCLHGKFKDNGDTVSKTNGTFGA